MTKKMVFVISALRGGGAEKFVLNLYKAMERYQGYECHIVAIEKAVEHDITGFRVHFVSDFCNVSKKGLRRLFYRKNVARAIDSFISSNISQDAFILSNMLLADKVMSESKLRVNHVIHSSYYSAFLKGKGYFKKAQIKRKINKTYRKHPLIFVSSASKVEYENNFYTNKRCSLIYNPIEVDEIKELSNARSKDKVKGDYFIHVGRFNRAKRHDRLILAYSKLNSHSVKLLLLGEGGLMDKAKNQVRDLGIVNDVEFGGFISNPYPYIKDAKGLILTSDYEGLPTVLIEAIALGTPVITTNCSGGIAEILDIESDSVVKSNNEQDIAISMQGLLDNPRGYIPNLSPKFFASEVSAQYHHLNVSYADSKKHK